MIIWILNLTVIFSISLFFFKKKEQVFSIQIYYLAFFLKLAAGVALGMVFIFFYGSGSDTFRFFDSAVSISSLSLLEHIEILFGSNNLKEWSEQPRARFFVKCLSIVTRLTNNSYWLSSLYLSALCFFSTWHLVTQITFTFSSLKKPLLFSFLLFPSVIFWTSGVTKDALAFFAFCLAISLIIKVYRDLKWNLNDLLMLLIALFLLLKVKHYLLISVILFSGILFSIFLLQRFSLKKGALLASLLIIISIVVSQSVHPYLNAERLALTLYENNSIFVGKTDLGDQIGLEMNEPTMNEVVRLFPKSLYIGLFKPNVLDIALPFGWIIKSENFLVLGLSIFTLILIPTYKNQIDWSIVIPAFIVIIMLASFLSLASPNYGSLVRYKALFLPFFVLLVSILPFRYCQDYWRNKKP